MVDTGAAQAVLRGAGGQVLGWMASVLTIHSAAWLNPHFIALAVEPTLLDSCNWAPESCRRDTPGNSERCAGDSTLPRRTWGFLFHQEAACSTADPEHNTCACPAPTSLPGAAARSPPPYPLRVGHPLQPSLQGGSSVSAWAVSGCDGCSGNSGRLHHGGRLHGGVTLTDLTKKFCFGMTGQTKWSGWYSTLTGQSWTPA